jgi:glycosyltransferase involved in cell wall biosynthesis
MISVIIPTYKEPEVLDLCLRSAIEGQHNNNEIIVVIDGFYDINKEVLEKYKNKINILNLEENVGMVRAMNLGIYNASNKLILVVNDDNIFPLHWDLQLENTYQPNSVISPNQIEPIPSIFKQFHIKDLGRDPNKFDLEAFWKYEIEIHENKIEETGSTPPFLISKIDYLKIGGWDESYPGPWVVDWEFFMKCEMAGMKMLRTYNSHFYHFVSFGTRPPEKINENMEIEQQCHEYFRYKWGTYIKHNPINNSKLIF